MCKLFEEWRDDIKAYCESNGLNFQKVENSARNWGRNDICLQHVDFDENPQKSALGMADDVPAPLTLRIFKEDGAIKFEQTEYTRKYLM